MDYVSIPFPVDLYNLVVIRSGGRLSPAQLAVDQVQQFIERNRNDPRFWTPEALREDGAKDESSAPDYGDADKAHYWSPLSLPNGTELRMRYRSKLSFARVERERIVGDGEVFESVSQWVRHVADNTSRNAWHDVWIKRPTDNEFVYSDSLRRASR